MKQIAQELKTASDSYVGLAKKIKRLAENFDFDGIIKLADKLGSTTPGLRLCCNWQKHASVVIFGTPFRESRPGPR